MLQLPYFKPGMTLNDLSAKELNNMVELLKQVQSISATYPFKVSKGSGGISISSDIVNEKTLLNKTIVIVEDPTEESEELVIRTVINDKNPPEHDAYRYGSESIVAYPQIGKKAIDYLGFVKTDPEEMPKAKDIFLKAYKKGLQWIVEFPASASFKQFRVLDFQGNGDYLRCMAWNGEEETGDPVKVFLPYELRKSRYDGKYEILSGQVVRYVAGPTLLERTAYIDAQGYSERQIITPQYVTLGNGGTGPTAIGPTIINAISLSSVSGGLGQPPDTPEEEIIYWMVQDARAWSEVYSQGSGQFIVQRMPQVQRGPGI